MDDIDAIIEHTKERTRRREAALQAGMVRGRHFSEWVEYLDSLRAAGDRDEEALALTLEVIEAAENAARIEDTEPPPGPTMRAAIIYRRRGERDAKIAILQRWIDACPTHADPHGWKPGQRLRKLLG